MIGLLKKLGQYQDILRMAGVPEFIIKYPQFIRKVPLTQEDIDWAKNKIARYKEDQDDDWDDKPFKK